MSNYTQIEPKRVADLPEAVLLRRAQNGDTDAFNALTGIYYARIVRVVNRYLRDPDDSLDVTQEAFVKAYLALPRFRGDSSFFTWLFEIAVNTAKNHLKAKSRRARVMTLGFDEAERADHRPELQDQASPEKLALRDELHEELLGALERMPAELRKAFVLRDIELLSYREIAEAFQCPVGTVRSRIFRARATVAAELHLPREAAAATEQG